MYNVGMLIMSIVFLGLNFFNASYLSEQGLLYNSLRGCVTLALIFLWAFLVSYHANVLLSRLV